MTEHVHEDRRGGDGLGGQVRQGAQAWGKAGGRKCALEQLA